MPAADTKVGRQPSNSADISSAIGGITRPVKAARPGPWRWASLKYSKNAVTEPKALR
jgi:hypothetical protein